MLKGRESLLRVIGKRRRFLPNRHSILFSSSSSQSCCKIDDNEKRYSPEKERSVESVDEEEKKCSPEKERSDELVNCPICGAQLPSVDNNNINSHLDKCLARGSKRKLGQLTLLQLNFSRSKVKVHSLQPEDEGNGVILSDPIKSSTCDTVNNFIEAHKTEEENNNQKESTFHSLALRSNSFSNCAENPIADDSTNNRFASAPFLLEIEKSTNVTEECKDEVDISKLNIPTFIVGRRFSVRQDLDPESRICLSRDPGNVKDTNAIKVLYADCEHDNMLGYLPRELAQYLSPLMDKFHLKFEVNAFNCVHSDNVHKINSPQSFTDGMHIEIKLDHRVNSRCESWKLRLPNKITRILLLAEILIQSLNYKARIISVPKNSGAAIPIQIVCDNMLLCDEKCSDNIQVYKSLWRHAVCAAELGKTGSFGMSRYQHNMVLLVEEVLKNNSHVLTIREKSFLEAFLSLPDDSQRLFARLYTRKGPWFRMSNVSYAEITDCDQAIKGLLEEGYIVSFPWRNKLEDNNFEEVLNLLNIDELREASRMLNKKCHHGTRKHDIIDLLLPSCKDGLCPQLQCFLLSRTGACVRISPLAESLIWRAERLFFLNGEQDLSAFLLVDLGIIKYPAYKCIISEHIFSNRSDLLSYEEAIEIAQFMDESLDENNSNSIYRCIEISLSRLSISLEESKSSTTGTIVTFLSNFSASWIYSKVVLLGVSFLEHEKRYSEAINILRQLLNTFISDGRRGYWTLRLSVDLEHLGHLDDSLQVAEDGILDPWVRAGSRVALQKRVLRLGKPPRRWKIPSYSKTIMRKISEVHVQGRPLNCKTGMKSIFYGEDGERCGVEELALQYYAGEGGSWQGVHTESGIWLTMFGILMWDVIFADVPNVFRTKFQTAPLDLDTDSFYETRKNLIEELLNKIQDGMAEEILITSYESHLGTACRGVNWEKHPLTELRPVVKCIGGPCLASLFRHLAQDYRSWSRGMPDLLLWRLHDCYRGEAKLVEVKGPRDRLSEQQRAWLLVLMDCGFSVEVCKVTPTPVQSE